MLLMNGNQIQDPQELSLICLPREGGGIRREVRAMWADVPPAVTAAILGPLAVPVNLTLTDPVTASRQTLTMALAAAQIEVAQEGAAGAHYRAVRLTLGEG